MARRGKGQSSVEAAMMISVMMLALAMFLAVTSDKLVEVQEKKDQQLLEDLAAVVENEMKLAAAAEEGYHRSFDLPTTVDGKNYSVILDKQNNELVVKYGNEYMEDYEYVVYLPKELNGTLCEGTNYLSKEKGAVNVSCNCVYGYVDSDGDGYTTGPKEQFCGVGTVPLGYKKGPSGTVDCNDNNPSKSILITCYTDDDADGFGGVAQNYCEPSCPVGTTSLATDCGNGNASIWQMLPCYADLDQDGFTTGNLANVCKGTACNTPLGHSSTQGTPDCDDTNAAKYIPMFADSDGDGYGNIAAPQCGPGAGIVDNSLDCDDTNRFLTLICGKRIFVTSQAFPSNLGGIIGADDKCQLAADFRTLGGTWKAWISNTTLNAADKLTRTTVLYQLLNGTNIANNWADFTDNTLNANINIDETGVVQNGNVWSGTNADGTKNPANCADWLSNTGSGIIGVSSMRDYRWSNSASASCTTTARLYCLEQCLVGYKDNDADGLFGKTKEEFCTQTVLPLGYSPSIGTDCDDANPSIKDELYTDSDKDGYGVGQKNCTGISSNNLDCNDNNNLLTTDCEVPIITNALPIGTVGSRTASITFTTSENANCRYSTTSGTPYASMSQITTTGGTSHSHPISGITNGYKNYYIICSDSAGNKNAQYTVSFNVEIKEVYDIYDNYSGTQGFAGFSYQAWHMQSYFGNPTYFFQSGTWGHYGYGFASGPEVWFSMAKGLSSPSTNYQPYWIWTAPKSGTARITGYMKKSRQGTECGLNTLTTAFYLYHDGTKLWEAGVNRYDTSQKNFNFTRTIAAGNKLIVLHNPMADGSCGDESNIRMRIELITP